MAKIPLPILFSRSIDEDSLPAVIGARLINAYVDKPAGQQGGSVIRKFPGLEVFVNLGVSAGIDGLYWWDAQNMAIAVCNGQIYKITTSDGYYSNITGDALAIVDRTSITDTGTYLFLASGGRMVTSNAGAATAFIADADAPTTVDHVAFLDQYILANKVGTGYLYWSDVNAPTAWTSTSFANAESKPDRSLALHIANREITLFGRESTEIWFNDGVNPFSRIDGAFIEQGCSAKGSIANAGGVWIWLNHERRVIMLEGRSPKFISGPYDDIIRDIVPVSDAISDFISVGKQAFYIISFPQQKMTFCYNLTNDTWSELGHWDSSIGEYTAWPGRSYCYAREWQYHLVGDKDSGIVYKLNPKVFLNNTSKIRTLMRTGWISGGTNSINFSNELLMRVKRGQGGTDGVEPFFEIRWRNENQIWTSWKQVSLGKIGDYEMLKSILRMGRYRLRQYEIVHSADTDFVLSDMEEFNDGEK